MYAMPGEVLNADRPGFKPFSMTQVIVGVGVFFALNLMLTIPFTPALLAAVLAALATGRFRGLYLWERLLYLGRAFIKYEMELAPETLAPSELYAAPETGEGRATYIVKSPDGRVLTLKE